LNLYSRPAVDHDAARLREFIDCTREAELYDKVYRSVLNPITREGEQNAKKRKSERSRKYDIDAPEYSGERVKVRCYGYEVNDYFLDTRQRDHDAHARDCSEDDIFTTRLGEFMYQSMALCESDSAATN